MCNASNFSLCKSSLWPVFSSESVVASDEENQLSTAGVRERFYGDVPVVEIYPQASVNAEDKAFVSPADQVGMSVVKGEKYFDANDSFVVPPPVLQS